MSVAMRARFYANDRMTCMDGEVLARYLDGTNLLSVNIPLRLRPQGLPLKGIPAREFVVADEDLAGRPYRPERK